MQKQYYYYILLYIIIIIIYIAFERLPTQILQEYCQKQKRPAPFYVPSRGEHQPHFLVILNDTKNEKDKLTFKPPARASEQNFESDKVAKDYAALIACFHFMVCVVLISN